MEQSQDRQTNLIRRLYIGPDYFQSMKYTVGSRCIKNTAVIEDINETSSGEFEILVKNDDGEIFLWKTVKDMPVCIEYNIDLF